MGFFFFHAHHSWASRMSSMNTCRPRTRVDSCLWKPRTSISSMWTLRCVILLWRSIHWQLSALGLFPRSLYGLYWACFVWCTLMWALSTRTPSLLQLQKGPCSRSSSAKETFITLPHCRCHTPSWTMIPFVGKIISWEAFYWLVNITHMDTTLPKILSLWVWAHLCYINSSTYLLFLHLGLPLTCVYSTKLTFPH
jgi:hypothetical protein